MTDPIVGVASKLKKGRHSYDHAYILDVSLIKTIKSRRTYKEIKGQSEKKRLTTSQVSNNLVDQGLKVILLYVQRLTETENKQT